MSGQEQASTLVKNAKRIESEAADWLQRQQFWKWTADDQALFEAWLGQATAHRIAYVRVSEIWKRTHRLTVLRAPMMQRISPQSVFRFHPLFKAIAGLVVICATGAGTYLYLTQPHEREVVTAVGEQRLVTLPDGSTIELNTNTAIRVSREDGARVIKLDRGEAYFDVRHDDAHPFTVSASGRRLTDLGTKFLVHSERDRLDVSVIEGRVLFDARQEGGGKVALLTPGDELVATAGSVTRFKKSLPELTTSLSWRHGVLTFKNTPLVDAVAEFNRYHENKLIIADAETGRLKIGGTFATDNVSAFIEVAQDVLGLHVAAKENETVLSR